MASSGTGSPFENIERPLEMVGAPHCPCALGASEDTA